MSRHRFVALLFSLGFGASIVACGSGGQPNPLATFDMPASNYAATEGTLVITERCVILLGDDGSERTLIWHEGSVSFDSSTRVITFENTISVHNVVELRDGDHVVLGGSGLPASGPEAQEPSFAYVRPPADACPPNIWHAGIVGLASEE